MLRTHTCGELRGGDDGSEVTLCGWVDHHRDLGQLFFITLRDRYGQSQCVYEGSEADLVSQLKGLSIEDCIAVTGNVRRRRDKDVNANLATGEVEVSITKIKVLNKSKTLPFQLRDEMGVSDDLRLKYRYLDLRRSRMQRNLAIRHQVIQSARSALSEMGFWEIETPLFVRSTPEGARDFVVPSRIHQGKFYALPQSPQLYKQLLMVSGCDRYFQFAAAFRDEDLRADRVPVHTQIDMEMSFVSEKDVFKAVEFYLGRIFKDVLNYTIPSPIQIMPYAEAMERFGSDKPDIRFGMEINTVTPIMKAADFDVFKHAESIRCIYATDGGAISRKDLDSFATWNDKFKKSKMFYARYKDGSFSGGVGKFITGELAESLRKQLKLDKEGVVIFAAGNYNDASKYLCQIRLNLGKKLNLIDESKFAFLWVNNFPLFEWNEDRGVFDAMHHHFCQPLEEDLPLLDSDPSKVRGQLYDLVLNGVELLSGSIRINRPEIQEKVFLLTGFTKQEIQDKFGFLVNSFEYGAPPHGGSAMGLDRITAILCKEESIRDVIAFPCNNQGVFPLDGSPATLGDDQYKELGLKK
jgi:aspartyl-tRNA synthetase